MSIPENGKHARVEYSISRIADVAKDAVIDLQNQEEEDWEDFEDDDIESDGDDGGFCLSDEEDRCLELPHEEMLRLG